MKLICTLFTNFLFFNFNQQDAPVFDYFWKDLHVSGGSSAHHQEHITVHSASGIVNQSCGAVL